MSLDEAKEDDKVFEENGITFIMDEQLFEQAKPINIDFISTAAGSGFSITSSLSGGSCGSCGGSCS
ncbi:MAG TPA: hypothetical protein PLA74_08005 [Syntrophales bacterium]|nr:hypothetical protein [Syntrophales bacterium]HPQ43201.1 hypothetical protein [Syntrophales bacterium]